MSDELKPCRGCDQRIRFVLTPKRKRMPVDPRPAGDGTIRLEPGFDGLIAVTLSGDELERARAANEPLYTSHFATCPKASSFRRRTRKSERKVRS